MGGRYGESGLHAADGSRIREQCAGIYRWDAPRCGDGSSQRTRRGDSAGHASINVSPDLCPGLPFIRSTRGSFHGDARSIFYLTHKYLIISLVARGEREKEFPRLGWSLDLAVHPVLLKKQLVAQL